jgi:hypothetical protein
LSDYSIADFLKSLTDDALEKTIIKLILEGQMDEELLTRLLEPSEVNKNDNL